MNIYLIVVPPHSHEFININTYFYYIMQLMQYIILTLLGSPHLTHCSVRRKPCVDGCGVGSTGGYKERGTRQTR